jgi:membrane-associated phospholipid phosphatase
MHQSFLIYLGDLRVTAALAGAVAVWLMVARHRRAAGWWCFSYCSAVAAVAASKIIYLGWGLQVAAIHFKAASGHAAGTAAVLPVVLYLLATSLFRGKENIALGVGWCISAAVVLSLVACREHTLSEALAGWCLGMVASTTTWWRMRRAVIQPSLRGIAAAVAIMAVIANGMQVVPIGRWITKTALALSGEQRTHSWSDS